MMLKRVRGANALKIGTPGNKTRDAEKEFLYSCLSSAHSELEQAVSTFNELPADKAID